MKKPINKKVEDEDLPSRLLVDLGSMSVIVRRMAKAEDRSINAQIRRLVRSGLDQIAKDKK